MGTCISLPMLECMTPLRAAEPTSSPRRSAFVLAAGILALLLMPTANITAQTNTAQTKNAEHIIVYHEVGKYTGWPANNGAWTSDGVNMLVGFTHGDYVPQQGHSIGGRQTSWLARSTDMGLTWTAWDPDGYVGDFNLSRDKKTLTNAIDFSHPQFAMRIVGTGYHGAGDPSAHYFYSYDLGRTWNGPYVFGTNDIRSWPELTTKLRDVVLTPSSKAHGAWKKIAETASGEVELTPRTDYIVEGKNSLLVFMGVRPIGSGFAGDKVFCMRTTDGGTTFNWVGWVVPPSDPHRAVMSQTIRLNSGKLISVARRRGHGTWIDAYLSTNNGQTWSFLSKVGDTGPDDTNGNPPALNITNNGRLVAVFGHRGEQGHSTPGTIRVAYSDNEGRTWSEPAILRDGFASEVKINDLGYPRLLRRKDGKMIAFYYWSTLENLHHIATTIWDADRQ
jgi:hypothetical protein